MELWDVYDINRNKIEGRFSVRGSEDMNDDELNEYARGAALENAEMYEYVVLGWDEDVYSYAESNG